MNKSHDVIRLRIHFSSSIRFYIAVSVACESCDLKKVIARVLKNRYNIIIGNFNLFSEDGFEILDWYRIGELLVDNQLLNIDDTCLKQIDRKYYENECRSDVYDNNYKRSGYINRDEEMRNSDEMNGYKRDRNCRNTDREEEMRNIDEMNGHKRDRNYRNIEMTNEYEKYRAVNNGIRNEYERYGNRNNDYERKYIDYDRCGNKKLEYERNINRKDDENLENGRNNNNEFKDKKTVDNNNEFKDKNTVNKNTVDNNNEFKYKNTVDKNTVDKNNVDNNTVDNNTVDKNTVEKDTKSVEKEDKHLEKTVENLIKKKTVTEKNGKTEASIVNKDVENIEKTYNDLRKSIYKNNFKGFAVKKSDLDVKKLNLDINNNFQPIKKKKGKKRSFLSKYNSQIL